MVTLGVSGVEIVDGVTAEIGEVGIKVIEEDAVTMFSSTAVVTSEDAVKESADKLNVANESNRKKVEWIEVSV